MVLKANTVPAVLLECGNISDASDEAFITDEKNQEIIARDILTGLAKYGQENAYVEPPSEKTTDALEPLSKCFSIASVRRVRTFPGSASPISICFPETRTIMALS